ncbi:CBS domain-containing protein [Pseudomonas citronellolis]|uniref:CBS domain-containing protein n=1 Tax=Pseudomonas citronellolis TaxID=53408 RepID=UPI000778E458|nr:CBS domain-containing protein [Pseudomonas citronellolis]AMO76774.1 inosine 5'-monophosphate dehydrogenase [Pseudomonas citronellolis]
MAIGEYCNRDVVIAAPTVSILTAARLMSEYHVGDLVLAEQVERERYRPVGIITDRDIVLEVVANNEPEPGSIQAGDIQLRNLITAKESDDVFDVITRMRQAGVRRMPVVDEQGLLVGIVSADDLLGVLADNLRDLSRLVGFQNLREEGEREADY